MRLKGLATICLVGIMAFSFTACGGKAENGGSGSAESTTAASGEAADAGSGDAGSGDAGSGNAGGAEVDPDSVRGKALLDVNGFKFGPGEKFTDVKDKLGDEVKPSSSAKPCDPNAKGELVTHYYDGFQVVENYENVISSIYLPGEGAANDSIKLASDVKVGTPKDAVISAFDIKADDAELEYGYNVQDGDFSIGFVWDDNGNVMSISIEDMAVRP